MDQYQVRDRHRILTFNGVLLAEASSRRRDASRWTELRLYQTVGGSYVLEKIGRSVVTHMPTCAEIVDKNLPRFQEVHPGADPDEDFEYHDCVPDEYDFTLLLVEQDRCWGLTTDSPTAVMEALKLKGRYVEQTRMPVVGRSLLDAAARVDARFKVLWTVQVT